MKNKLIINRIGKPITKSIINLTNLKNYDNLLVNKGINYLNYLLDNEIINTIEMLDLIKNNYNNSVINTINNISFDLEKNRLNCVYLSMLLKKYLDSIGINSCFITYSSNGFTTESGNKKIKEIHLSLIYPSIKNGRIFFTIFDPGLRIRNVIQFYDKSDSKTLICDDISFKVLYNNDIIYPYKLDMDGYLSNYVKVNRSITLYFNPYYYTEGLKNIYDNTLYKYILNYKAVSCSSISSKRAFIKISPILKYISFGNDIIKHKYSYDDFIKLNYKYIYQLLDKFTCILNIDTFDIIDTIYFMINHSDSFDLVIDKDVYKEYESSF